MKILNYLKQFFDENNEKRKIKKALKKELGDKVNISVESLLENLSFNREYEITRIDATYVMKCIQRYELDDVLFKIKNDQGIEKFYSYRNFKI